MSGRATWIGSISFGLVNVPVKLYAATEEHDLEFRQVHVHEDREPGRIKYKRVCSVCGDEVSYSDIAKGYETEDGIVILTKEDFASIPLDTISTIEVHQFVPDGSVDPILFERTYTVTPEIPNKAKGKPAGLKVAKAYGLLTAALASSGKVGIAKVTLRQREQLAMLSVRNGRMALTTLRWADEIREMPEASYPEASPEELAVALMFIESLSADEFDHGAYKDGFKAALEAVVAAKRAGLTPEPPKAEQEAPVTDLMAALRASIEANKAKRTRERSLKVVA